MQNNDNKNINFYKNDNIEMRANNAPSSTGPHPSGVETPDEGAAAADEAPGDVAGATAYGGVRPRRM